MQLQLAIKATREKGTREDEEEEENKKGEEDKEESKNDDEIGMLANALALFDLEAGLIYIFQKVLIHWFLLARALLRVKQLLQAKKAVKNNVTVKLDNQ